MKFHSVTVNEAKRLQGAVSPRALILVEFSRYSPTPNPEKMYNLFNRDGSVIARDFVLDREKK